MDLLSQARKVVAFLPRLAVRLKVPAGGKLKSRSPTSKRLGHEASDMPLALLLGGWRQPFPFLGRVPGAGNFFRRNAAALDHERLWRPLHRRKPSRTRNASAPKPARIIANVTTISDIIASCDFRPTSARSPNASRADAPGLEDRRHIDALTLTELTRRRFPNPAAGRIRELRPAGLRAQIFAFTGGGLSRVSAICDVSRMKDAP